MSIKIENVDITRYLKKDPSDTFAQDFVTICALQLFSPFKDGDEALNISQHRGHPCFVWSNDEAYINRSKRINYIMGSISLLNQKRNIDILVFPEYAFPEASLKDLLSFSKAENIILISNHYQEHDRHNVTYVIMPDGTKYKSLKLNESEYEKDYLAKVSYSDYVIYHFTWDHESGRSYFQTYACLDFLNYFMQPHVNNEMPGIIFVPMSSTEVLEFEAIGKFIIRTGDKCSTNKAVVLVNASSRKRMHRSMFGSSQIIAPFKSTAVKLDKFIEGAIIADITPSHSFSQPTPLYRENSIVKSLVTFKYDANGNINESVEDSQNRISINPNIFRKLGLSKLYVFFKVREYNNAKPALKILPISCNGIFGVHDILFQSYEENYDFFKIRLEHYLGLKEGLLIEPETYPITECYKFRGKKLIKDNVKNRDDEPVPVEGEATSIDIDRNKEIIRRILLGEDVGEEKIIQNLLDKGVLISGTGQSDISQSEQGEGFEEFLTFIFFLERDINKLSDSIKKFKRHILPLLINDDRIRTIELSGNVFGGPSIAACCILHVVGTLNDMRGIILDDLHKNMSKYDIIYGTRMVPVAELLAKDMYLALQEIQTRDTTSKTVLEIIHFLKGYEDPFMIKRIPDREIEKICRLYDDFKEWIGRHPKFRQHKPLYLRIIDEFIYGIAYAVTQSQSIFHQDFYEHYSMRFISQISKMCEEVIYSRLREKAKEIGEYKFLKTINTYTDKKGKPLNYDFKETTLGKLIPAVVFWNEKCEADGLIVDDDFTEDIKKLQDFIPYRNVLAHHSDKQPKHKEIEKLLDNVEIALSFLKKYT